MSEKIFTALLSLVVGRTAATVEKPAFHERSSHVRAASVSVEIDAVSFI
jgi:hypothetical protein